jgi:MFS family permease
MLVVRKIALVEVLKIGPFRALWLAQLFSQIGINLLTFVLAIQIYHLTGRNTAVSLLTLSFIVPQALFGSLAGVIVDRYDKKIVLFVTNLSRALVVLLFLFTRETVVFICLLAVLVSFITQFFVPAEAPIIPSLVPKNKLLTANGLFTLTIFVTMLAGGLLAGPMLDLLGLDWAVIIVFLAYLLASVNIIWIPGQPVWPALKRNLGWAKNFLDREVIKQIKSELAEGRNYVWQNKKILLAIGLLVGSQTMVASITTLLPGFADANLHLRVNDASVMLLGPAILGIILGAVTVSQFSSKLVPARIIPAGILGAGMFMTLLGLAPNLYEAQLFLLGLGFSNALVDVPCNAILQGQTAEAVRSRVYGVLTALGGVVFILPVLLSGSLADMFGVDRVFVGFGVIIALALIKLKSSGWLRNL